MNHLTNNLDQELNDQFERQKFELEKCEICLQEIPGNQKTYKFKSTNFNKDVKCGCYDCYIFELENQI